MNDVPRSAPVQDHRDGAARESFKNHSPSALTNGRKYHHIRRSQVTEDFSMATPAAERDSLFDSKGCCEFLKAASLRSVTEDGKVGQIVSQNRCRSTQSDVAGFSANQSANENQLEFGVGLRTTRVSGTHRASDTILGNKKQLVLMRRKLGAHVRRSGNDRRRVAIGGSGKRHKPV